MTNVVDCRVKFPIQPQKEYGLTIDYGDEAEFFSSTGDFWTISAAAAISYANVQRENAHPTFKNFGKKVFPRTPKYKIVEINSGNAKLEPEPLTTIDKQMAIDAAEKYIPDALWVMVMTNLITQDDINNMCRFPNQTSLETLTDRVKISR